MSAAIPEARAALARAALSRSPGEMLYAGGLVLNAGLEAEALAPVQAMVKSNPDNGQLWLLLGILLRRTEDLGPSVSALRRAAELQPKDFPTAGNLAFASFEAGLPAARLFQRAQRLGPAEHAILLGHAAALVAEGQMPAAIRLLQQELRRSPGWVEGHSRLARLRWASGDRDRFADSFEHAVKQQPRSVELWRAYLETFTQAGLHEEASSRLPQARAAAGEQLTFMGTEAICRSELGDFTGAEPIFQRLLPTRDLGVTEHYVRHLFRHGRAQEALAITEDFMRRSPQSRLWPYLSVGWRLTGDPRWEWLEGDPSFIAVMDISGSLPPLNGLADCLRRLHSTIGQPLDQSVRGGTQTDGHLLPRIEPEIRQLRDAIVAAVRDYVQQLPPPRPGHPLLIDKRAPIRFSGSWSVRLSAGGSHVDHFHPAGWISSALYVSLPAEVEAEDGDFGWLVLGEAGGLDVNLPPIRKVQPKPGRLVLFPSTMWHGTRPFSAGERLTVAFDVQRPR